MEAEPEAWQGFSVILPDLRKALHYEATKPALLRHPLGRAKALRYETSWQG